MNHINYGGCCLENPGLFWCEPEPSLLTQAHDDGALRVEQQCLASAPMGQNEAVEEGRISGSS
jgi:hypothetical protein